ncbi:response regulator transcription factor [Sinosporangium siamense]|nr:LuxR C-terminal-related transcriptional regulator [Sinosporangium siamense]
MFLTPRQSQIMTLIAEGHSNKEIASRLGLSSKTVNAHLQRVYDRYGVRNRAAAVAKWLREEPRPKL